AGTVVASGVDGLEHLEVVDAEAVVLVGVGKRCQLGTHLGFGDRGVGDVVVVALVVVDESLGEEREHGIGVARDRRSPSLRVVLVVRHELATFLFGSQTGSAEYAGAVTPALEIGWPMSARIEAASQ